MRSRWIMLLAALTLAAAAAPVAVDPAIRAWAFIALPRAAAPPDDDPKPRSLPGTTVTFTDAALRDLGHVVDWFPRRHAPLPAVVAGRGGGAMACGYCHLAAGEGRVENASLAGLSAGYIRAQVAAFAAGTRVAAAPDYLPSRLMVQVAKAVSADDLAAAATYFAAAHFVPRVHVVEAATVPATVPGHFILTRVGSGTEQIARRIVEMPDDHDAFERRDPRVAYTAFVPPGSIAAGRGIATRLGCAACHGAGMKLWGAGRSPTYIFRQLLAFRTGARHDPDAAPMTAIAGQLTPPDMVAVAAYWGSLRP